MKNVVCMMMVVGLLLVGSMTAVAETYTIGVLATAGWTQYKVAEVKGFWKKHGVDVKIVDYVWPLDSAKAGAQRRFDLTPLPLTYLVTFQNGGAFDAVYLGSFSVANLHKYLVIKKELADKALKGQTIGNFLPCAANDYFIAKYLNTVKTNFTDIRQVEMNPDGLQTNFTLGRLKAVLTLDLGDKFYEQADGMVALSTQGFYEPHGLCVIKSGGKTAIPPEDLKNILRGVVDAILWMDDPANWEEYKSLLKEYIGLPDLPDEQLRRLTQNHTYPDPQTLIEQNQQPLRDLFTDFRGFLAEYGSLKEEVFNAFTYENAIYNQPLIEVLQEYVK